MDERLRSNLIRRIEVEIQKTDGERRREHLRIALSRLLLGLLVGCALGLLVRTLAGCDDCTAEVEHDRSMSTEVAGGVLRCNKGRYIMDTDAEGTRGMCDESDGVFICDVSRCVLSLEDVAGRMANSGTGPKVQQGYRSGRSFELRKGDHIPIWQRSYYRFGYPEPRGRGQRDEEGDE